MMSKKHRRLYDRAMFGKQRKAEAVDNLRKKARKVKKIRAQQ